MAVLKHGLQILWHSSHRETKSLQEAEEAMLCQFPSLGLKKSATSSSCPLGHSLLEPSHLAMGWLSWSVETTNWGGIDSQQGSPDRWVIDPSLKLTLNPSQLAQLILGATETSWTYRALPNLQIFEQNLSKITDYSFKPLSFGVMLHNNR